MAAPPISAATLVLRHNERTKLAAAILDKLAVTVAAAGYIAPIVNGSLPGNIQSAVTLLWMLLAAILWGVAYFVLGRLQ